MDIITTLSSAAGLIWVVLLFRLHLATFGTVAARVFSEMSIRGCLKGLNKKRTRLFQVANIILLGLRCSFFPLTVGDFDLTLCGRRFCLSFATAAFLRRAEASRSCEESDSFRTRGLRSFEIGCLDCESIHIQIPAPGSRQEDKS